MPKLIHLRRILAITAVLALSGCGKDGGTNVPPPAPTVRDRVAYIAGEAGVGAILVTERLDGSDRRRLAGPVALQRFMWSPDGSRIAYVVGGTSNSHIFVVDVNTGARTQLTTERDVNTEPSWSPDGRSIVFRSGCALWMMNADGSNQRAVAPEGFGGCPTLPDWSPDGSRILFLTWGGGGGVMQWMNAAGTTSGVIEGFFPEGPWGWSPDGSRVVFANREANGGQRGYVIRTARPDGTDIRRVGWVPGLAQFGVAWVNATTVGFTRRASEASESLAEVWTMNIDGTGLSKTPIPPGAAFYPRWQ